LRHDTPLKLANSITKILGACNARWHVSSALSGGFKEVVLDKIAAYFAAIMGGLAFWRRDPPITDAPALAMFCIQRALFVAQTTLYGYLRTRAGLQHFNLFTDKAFTPLLREARSRLVLVCLEDLAIYAAGLLPNAAAATRCQLAIDIFAQGVATLAGHELAEDDLVKAQKNFEATCQHVAWAASSAPDKGIAAFSKSAKALIELAPIVDALKKYDDEIVTNSMHFKWHGVRADLRARLDGDALLASLT
jgi:hypothetical protein